MSDLCSSSINTIKDGCGKEYIKTKQINFLREGIRNAGNLFIIISFNLIYSYAAVMFVLNDELNDIKILNLI